uniref:Rho-GAP domain-containing protein n=1 Tax=Denticeps clupeoides TaxID=299321 RepID=A0AAY4C5R8_9TELE
MSKITFSINIFLCMFQLENIHRRRWRNVFGRLQKKGLQSGAPLNLKKSLFGQDLCHVCEDRDALPKPIMGILMLLWRNGPYTEGVFRKAGNARALREIKEQLDCGADVNLDDKTTVLLAALLKDFLRNLPGGLLMVEHYQAWMTALETRDVDERCMEIQKVIEKLPEQNVLLLRHLVFVLHHISQHEERNKMSTDNLAICIAPNLLHVDQVDMVEKVKLTGFLIDHCSEIFGENPMHLPSDSDEEEFSETQDCLSVNQHDSAYETDADADKGSNMQLATCSHMQQADGAPESYHISPLSSSTFSSSIRPFLRRCSEPDITVFKASRRQTTLTRSHTDFFRKGEEDLNNLLRKQISDECIVQDSSSVRPQACHSSPSKIHPCCSSCSLESAFSSASESSISTPTTSPSIHRRSLDLPLFPRQEREERAIQRRSQSLRCAATQNRLTLRRGHSSKFSHPQKALLRSQTLPEYTFSTSSLSSVRILSSEEVFKLVDSKVPGLPPSYQQATRVRPAPQPLSGSMTVQDARRFSTSPASICEEPPCSSANGILHSSYLCHVRIQATDGPLTLPPELASQSGPAPEQEKDATRMSTDLPNTRESYV